MASFWGLWGLDTRTAAHDPNLDAAISEFSHNGYSTDGPGCTYGDCLSNSQDFLRTLHRQQPGLNPELYRFFHPSVSAFPSPARRDLQKSEENPGYWETNDPIDEGVFAPAEHYSPVVTHGGQKYVVDWALRQFDPRAKLPHVEPLEAYGDKFSYYEPDDEDSI